MDGTIGTTGDPQGDLVSTEKVHHDSQESDIVGVGGEGSGLSDTWVNGPTDLRVGGITPALGTLRVDRIPLVEEGGGFRGGRCGVLRRAGYDVVRHRLCRSATSAVVQYPLTETRRVPEVTKEWCGYVVLSVIVWVNCLLLRLRLPPFH